MLFSTKTLVVDLKPLLITALSANQSLDNLLTELEQQQLLTLTNVQRLFDNEITQQHGLAALRTQQDLTEDELNDSLRRYLKEILNNDAIKHWFIHDNNESSSASKALAKATLHLAAEKGYEVMLIKLLAAFSEVERLAVVNELNHKGRTVLQEAANSGNTQAFETVLALYPKTQRLAAAKATDKDGNTLLHLAVKSGNGEIFLTVLALYPPEERLAAVKTYNHKNKMVFNLAVNENIRLSDRNLPLSSFIAEIFLELCPEEQRLTAVQQLGLLDSEYLFDQGALNCILQRLNEGQREILLQHKRGAYYKPCGCPSYCNCGLFYRTETILHRAVYQGLECFAQTLSAYGDRQAQLAALNEPVEVTVYLDDSFFDFFRTKVNTYSCSTLEHLFSKNCTKETCDYVYELLQQFPDSERYQLFANFWRELLIIYCMPGWCRSLSMKEDNNLTRYLNLLTTEDKFQLIKTHAELIVKYYQQQHLPQTDFEALVLVSAEAAKYQAHWQRLTGSVIDKIVALLQHYTGYNSSTYRFFTGAWNRHHLEKVEVIINAFSVKQIEEGKQLPEAQQLLAELEAIELDNPLGSLGILRVMLKHQLQQLSASTQELIEINTEQKLTGLGKFY